MAEIKDRGSKGTGKCALQVLTSYSPIELRSQILNDEITREITMLLYMSMVPVTKEYILPDSHMGTHRQCFHACRECTIFIRIL